jgi:glutamate synthase (NADPH/NADH) small chain
MVMFLKRQQARWIFRLAIFFIAWIGVPFLMFTFFWYGTMCFADPFFWLQRLGILIGQGTLLDAGNRTLILISLTVFGLIIFTIAFGRAFCSWICPYGTLLDLLGKVKSNKKHLPEAIQEKSIKYGVLLGFLVSAMALGWPVWCDICPAGAAWRASGPFIYAFPWLLMLSLTFFFVVTIMAVFYDGRGWCKFLCPLGAFIAIVDKISLHRVRLPADRCVECGRCEDVCPMDIDLLDDVRYEFLNDAEVRKVLDEAGIRNPSREKFDELPENVRNVLSKKVKSYRVPAGECIRCFQCVDNCPIVTDQSVVPTTMLDPLERVHHFKEVNLGYTEELAVKEAMRCLQCEDHPCTDACPAKQDVPGYIKAIMDVDPSKSLEIILETNPLPLTCGRVCPAFCKQVCVRGKSGDPIAIPTLKRYAADFGKFPKIKQERETGKRVAVIGAGPAGLTIGWELAKMGHGVTIFEELNVSGGMLAVGIPEYRLPKKILNKEIDRIKAQGVEIKNESPIGKDTGIKELFDQGFDAVFIGVGAHVPKAMRVPGEELEGVYHASTFLKDVNLGQEVVVGKKVAVIGGGNVAMDAVRTSLRLGAKKAMIVYRRAEEQMPADPLEIEESKEEGVEYHLLRNPTKIIEKDGKVVGMELIKMELGEPDSSGRRRPVPIEGSEYVIECDMVVPAISQSPELSWLPAEDLGIVITKWNTVEVNEATGMSAMEGVFAAGDDVSGPATVIEAIAAARVTAKAIDAYLRKDKAAS